MPVVEEADDVALPMRINDSDVDFNPHDGSAYSKRGGEESHMSHQEMSKMEKLMRFCKRQSQRMLNKTMCSNIAILLSALWICIIFVQTTQMREMRVEVGKAQ